MGSNISMETIEAEFSKLFIKSKITYSGNEYNLSYGITQSVENSRRITALEQQLVVIAQSQERMSRVLEEITNSINRMADPPRLREVEGKVTNLQLEIQNINNRVGVAGEFFQNLIELKRELNGMNESLRSQAKSDVNGLQERLQRMQEESKSFQNLILEELNNKPGNDLANRLVNDVETVRTNVVEVKQEVVNLTGQAQVVATEVKELTGRVDIMSNDTSEVLGQIMNQNIRVRLLELYQMSNNENLLVAEMSKELVKMENEVVNGNLASLSILQGLRLFNVPKSCIPLVKSSSQAVATYLRNRVLPTVQDREYVPLLKFIGALEESSKNGALVSMRDVSVSFEMSIFKI